MPVCNTNQTNIPDLPSEPCNGDYTDSQCVVHESALTYLNLPANSSLSTIITAFITALQFKDEQISNLQDQIDALS